MAEQAPAPPPAPESPPMPGQTAAETAAALAEAAGLSPGGGDSAEKPSLISMIDLKMWIVIFGGSLLLLLLFALPSVIVVCVGMLPAVVAAVIDRTEKRHAVFSVSSLNFAGVFPFLLGVWTGDNSVSQALNAVTSAFALSVMYAAAALGWLLYLAVPPVIAQFLSALAQRRVDALHAAQRTVIEKWGPEAAGGDDVSHLGLASGDEEEDDGDDGGDDGLAPPKAAA